MLPNVAPQLVNLLVRHENDIETETYDNLFPDAVKEGLLDELLDLYYEVGAVYSTDAVTRCLEDH